MGPLSPVGALIAFWCAVALSFVAEVLLLQLEFFLVKRCLRIRGEDALMLYMQLSSAIFLGRHAQCMALGKASSGESLLTVRLIGDNTVGRFLIFGRPLKG